MKKNKKQLLVIIFCLMVVTSCFSFSQAKAANNRIEVSVDFLNRQNCWNVAEQYLYLGYSQPDIAVEIYAHALLDNISYKTLKTELVKCGSSKSLLKSFAKWAGEHSHEVNIGGDNGSPDPFLKVYYALWSNVFLPDNNYYYTIHSDLDQNKVIDVSNNSNKNGAKIQLYSKNNTKAQEFELFLAKREGETSYYYIFKKGKFKCLDVTGGKVASGVNVQLYDYNGTAAQQWNIITTGNAFYIKNKLGYFMDACGGSSANGTQIWVYSGNGTSAQKWWLDAK